MKNLFELIEYTQRSVFLTGRAGTGKTTFLNEFVKKTQKKNVVVAPTGIAAINAGGVTIHSLFGIPPRTFVPTYEEVDRNYAMNINDALHHFRYRKDKRKLLREIEIVIVDEVSMLRADLLDMMDLSLRTVRRNPQPFGGVQLLLIGDLYQLPPVVRNDSQGILSRFYESPFFFSAKALADTSLVTVELTEVYRQRDPEFLQILNAVREADLYDLDFEKLNSRYMPDFEPGDQSYVYLCSHNRMADQINQRKINALKGGEKTFQAVVVGDFNETQYPNDQFLELKVGAQVMFIRNDTSPDKLYYNGRLAKVSFLSLEEVRVILDDTNVEITVHREVWEQKRYSVDLDKNIQEDVIGSFEQYPLRLAWAVTIHKSQGLTFDRVIIDAGKSFASGQVYVALSRCRTLEGVVLKSQITQNVIFTDPRIDEFQNKTGTNDIEQIVKDEKNDYALHKIELATDLSWLQSTILSWSAAALTVKNLNREKAKELSQSFKVQSQKLLEIDNKFKLVLKQKGQQVLAGEIEWSEIENKCKGAVNFYYKNLLENFLRPMEDFYSETKGVKGLKSYNVSAKEFLETLEEYLDGLKRSQLIGIPLFDKMNEPVAEKPTIKRPSHLLTYQLFEEGKSVEDIGKERGLVKSTIYGHLAKMAEVGVLDLQRLFTDDQILEFKKIYDKGGFENLTDLKQHLPDSFDFPELRILLNHFNYLKHKQK